MKIIYDKTIFFGDLDIGKIFRFDGRIYLKTESIDSEEKTFNCLMLNNGTYKALNYNTQIVSYPNATLNLS